MEEEDGIGGPEETDGNCEWGWGCCHGLCTVWGLVLLGVVVIVVAADIEGFGGGLGLRLGFAEAVEEDGCGCGSG